MAHKFKNISDAMAYVGVIIKPAAKPDIKTKPLGKNHYKPKQRELIAGGDPVREPVNKSTAIVVAPAPWWAKPLPQPKKEHKTMSKTIGVTEVAQEYKPNPNAIKVKRVNGEDLIDLHQVQQIIMDQIAKLPKDASPVVKQAKESREIIDQLLHGIGGDMQRFQAEAKEHVKNIRTTRYTVVTETSTMMNALKDVRQFFLGSDYKEEIGRLTEFVSLCERLQKLKTSGFLDAVADTIIKLDRPD